MMDAQRRSQYLQAIGIDVWVPRRGGLLGSRAAAPADAIPGADIAVRASAEVIRPPAEAAVAPAAGAAHPASLQAPASPAVTAGRAVTGAAPAATAGPQPVLSRKPGATEPLSPELDAQWEMLRSEVAACVKCGLHSTRTQGVFGVGNRQSDWLVIGEAPGAEEDRRGEPFVGRAGQLLDAMLRAIDLSRNSNVYIANVLKSRPPGNRDPKPEEVAACLPYLIRQIALLRPRLMLAVGRIAAQNLLNTDVPLGRLRGKIHHFGELNTPLIVTYHPAYLLRTPADKRKAWEDLKFARNVFRQLA